MFSQDRISSVAVDGFNCLSLQGVQSIHDAQIVDVTRGDSLDVISKVPEFLPNVFVVDLPPISGGKDD